MRGTHATRAPDPAFWEGWPRAAPVGHTQGTLKDIQPLFFISGDRASVLTGSAAKCGREALVRAAPCGLSTALPSAPRPSKSSEATLSLSDDLCVCSEPLQPSSFILATALGQGTVAASLQESPCSQACLSPQGGRRQPTNPLTALPNVLGLPMLSGPLIGMSHPWRSDLFLQKGTPFFSHRGEVPGLHRLTESDLGHMFWELAKSNVCFSCSSEQTNSVNQAGSFVA